MNTWKRHKPLSLFLLIGALMLSADSLAWQNQGYNRGNFGYYNNNYQHNPYYRGNIYRNNNNYFYNKKLYNKNYNNYWRYKQGNYFNNYWYNPGIIRTCKMYQVCSNYGGCTIQQLCY